MLNGNNKFVSETFLEIFQDFLSNITDILFPLGSTNTVKKNQTQTKKLIKPPTPQTWESFHPIFVNEIKSIFLMGKLLSKSFQSKSILPKNSENKTELDVKALFIIELWPSRTY